MTRTVTALFDTREDAEAGRNRLTADGVDASNVHIHDQSSEGYKSEGYSTATTDQQGRGIWASVKNALVPDEDRHTYEEGIRRGGYLLTADVDENSVDRAVAALEESKSIDIDHRAGEWRNQGWDYDKTNPSMFGAAAAGLGRDTLNNNEQSIPVVEESLVVGKREVERGGVRVRSYVTETPVSEQIRLRNERVDVERRPVDRAMTGADAAAFEEKTISMTAKGEEAVVGKNARVVEEVVVRKTADETNETVSDTVRKTEVEIENDTTRTAGTTTTGTTGMGTTGTSKL